MSLGTSFSCHFGLLCAGGVSPAGFSALGAGCFSAGAGCLSGEAGAELCPIGGLIGSKFKTCDEVAMRRTETIQSMIQKVATPMVIRVNKSPALVPKALCPPMPPKAPAKPPPLPRWISIKTIKKIPVKIRRIIRKTAILYSFKKIFVGCMKCTVLYWLWCVSRTLKF
jgi:hypothetical protein